MTAGVRLRVGDSIVSPPPGVGWAPIGPIITEAKMAAAGATTRHLEGAHMNINFPMIFRRPSWWAGPAGWGQWIMLFAGHNAANILAAHTSTLSDPDSWTIIATPVLTYEEAIDRAADLAPDGLISPVRVANLEHNASPSVFVDHTNQRFLVMTHAFNDTARTNLNNHATLGWTTSNFSDWTLYGPVGASKSLLYTIYARWAEPQTEVVGTDKPLIVGTDPGIIQRGGMADWFARSENANWANTTDTINEDHVDSAGGQDIRHPCLYKESPTRARMYYSTKAGAPERIESVLIDTTTSALSGWRTIAGSWRIEREPDLDWEGVGLGGVPSAGSEAPAPVEQLRDPFVFDDGSGGKWMACAIQGEYGIGLYKWV